MKPMRPKVLMLAAALPLLYLGDDGGDAGPGLIPTAHAIVGAPLTPMSVAGAARRTTRRVVAVETTAAATATAATATAAAATATATAAAQAQQQAAKATAPAPAPPTAAPAVGTIVNTLPGGCTQVTKAAVAYQDCGGVFYRAAFQGNSLVYVVSQP